MNVSGGASLSPGTISARIDRLPATRTIWTIIVLLGFGMFFELYDLLFSAYVAPSLVKSGVLTAQTRGLFGATGVASFIAALFTGFFIGTLLCGFLADRFGRRAIFTWSLLWYSAAEYHGGAADRRGRPQPVAAGLRRRPRRRDRHHRRLLKRACAQGHSRPRLRRQPGDRLRLRAGRLVPRLAAGADRAAGARGLALGGADRGAGRAGGGLLAARPAREPALARQAWEARRGRLGVERARSQSRSRVRPAAAAARP